MLNKDANKKLLFESPEVFLNT